MNETKSNNKFTQYIFCKRIQMQQKSKRQLLDQRLQRIKKNSQQLISRMDSKINSMQQVKNDLNNKSQRMTKWTNDFQQLMSQMAKKMLGNYRNPLIEDTSGVGMKPRKQSVQFICQKILDAKKICILTGAGVSKNIGIPTFRGKDGLYSKNFTIETQSGQLIQYSPQQFLTMKTFQNYPDQVWKWCQQLKSLIQEKNPGIQHHLIHQICMRLKNMGKNVVLVTTNIDSMHKQQQKSSQQKYQIYQIHGNLRQYMCSNCLQKYQSNQDYRKFICIKCKSNKLRPFVMFFDQKYDNTFDPSNLRFQQFDLIFVIGTSLQTGLSIKIVSSSKVIIQINPQSVIKVGEVYQFQSQCQKVLVQILNQLKKQV